MGYIFWIVLLAAISFRAYEEGQWQKQLNTFVNDIHNSNMSAHFLFWVAEIFLYSSIITKL